MSRRGYIDAEDLIDRIDPEQFYRYELPITAKRRPTRGGWVNGGLCPFHDDKRAGSFFVNFDTGAFKCYSAKCDEYGPNVIVYVMRTQFLSYREALELLASEWL